MFSLTLEDDVDFNWDIGNSTLLFNAACEDLVIVGLFLTFSYKLTNFSIFWSSASKAAIIFDLLFSPLILF